MSVTLEETQQREFDKTKSRLDLCLKTVKTSDLLAQKCCLGEKNSSLSYSCENPVSLLASEVKLGPACLGRKR